MSPQIIHTLVDLLIIVLLVAGVAQFRSPRSARRGNLTAAGTLLLALGLVLYRNDIFEPGIVAAAVLVGSLVGAVVAARVTMIQIPAMVAFQHGAGGVAAFAIAFVELTRPATGITVLGETSGLLGLVIGAGTFSGSMLAGGKLAAKLKQTPTVVPFHNAILVVLALGVIACSVAAVKVDESLIAYLLGGALVLAMILGVVFAMRIGGADMPVLISFLNATAGLAAAFCGVAIQNRLLIACGATVAASGSILTAVMCKAMNRSLLKVFTGGQAKTRTAENPASPAMPAPAVRTERTFVVAMAEAKQVLREANKVIVIPGYGMALARAQFNVASLAKRLEQMGKDVKFAIHPVAGRMPGHMNVLLAEADVDYDKLCEMDDVNREFAKTDAVLVVGACDVVNPAAIKTEGTPISGMPILNAYEAKNVLVCNLDERPGYSGVKNPLYDENKTLLLFGDAGNTITELLESLKAA